MESVVNKNIIKFNVAGALDFYQTLTIELYNQKVDGAEEIPINDFLKVIAYDICSIVSHYISWQVSWVVPGHHFNVSPKNIWVRGVRFFHHSHEGWGGGRMRYLNFQEIVEELKREHSGYELEFNGYDYKTHIKELKKYFESSIIVRGEEEKLTEEELKYIKDVKELNKFNKKVIIENDKEV